MVEWGGVLVLVATIIAALLASGLPSQISHGLSQAVADALGGARPAASGGPSAPGTPHGSGAAGAAAILPILSVSSSNGRTVVTTLDGSVYVLRDKPQNGPDKNDLTDVNELLSLRDSGLTYKYVNPSTSPRPEGQRRDWSRLGARRDARPATSGWARCTRPGLASSGEALPGSCGWAASCSRPLAIPWLRCVRYSVDRVNNRPISIPRCGLRRCVAVMAITATMCTTTHTRRRAGLAPTAKPSVARSRCQSTKLSAARGRPSTGSGAFCRATSRAIR